MYKAKRLLEADLGTTIDLDRSTLGYATEERYAQHTVQCIDLGGGTWNVWVLGPADKWEQIDVGLGEGSVVTLGPDGSWSALGTLLPRQRFRAIRIVLVGTTGNSVVGIESYGVATHG